MEQAASSLQMMQKIIDQVYDVEAHFKRCLSIGHTQ